MYKNVAIEDYSSFKRPCTFDPDIDNQEVDQFGFVDLHEAFEKGVVPSVVPLSDNEFNEVALPGTLMSHAQDVFESIRQAEYVRDLLKYADENLRKSAEHSLGTAAAPSQPAEPSAS